MKTGHFSALMIIACIAMIVQNALARQGFIGQRVSLSREVPSIPFTYGPFEFVAQAGFGDVVALSSGSNCFVNVESARLDILFGPDGGSGGPFPTMGHYILFQELSSSAPAIAGMTFSTNLQGFNGWENLTFSDHSIMIGVGGLDWYGGEYLSIGVQFVPQPVLNITTSGQNILLSWLIPSRPFTLQQSSDLATWSAVGVTPTYTNLHYEVSISMTGNRNFFRLVSQ